MNEFRYGQPQADLILKNRHYTIGYSYYFRQAKWALEIVDSAATPIERLDNFRSDLRINSKFRPDLIDYKKSGYDRGHLVASANQRDEQLQNSETFLLSNISPQTSELNRGPWRKLENSVRELNNNNKYFETYVISGPLFYFDTLLETIGTEDNNDVSIPIPHAFFKSILAERSTGKLYVWSFILPNKQKIIWEDLVDFQVPTSEIENLAGLHLWENIHDVKFIAAKDRVWSAKWLNY